MTIDEAVEQACSEVGILPPKRWSHGKWTKTDTEAGRNGKGDGRIIVNDVCVTAWNWQTGERSTVGLRNELSATERQAVARDVSRAKAKAEVDARKAASMGAELILASTLAGHAYLAAKGFPDEKAMIVSAETVRDIVGPYIVPEGAQQAIIIPARRGEKVTSAQLIWEDGTKKFLFGGEISGTSHRIATGATTWLCEGLATGLSVRAALRGLKMQATVLCCFSASNVACVARQAKGRAYIAADHDKPLPHPPFNGLGTGEFYAIQAGLPYGMPPAVKSDFNDLHQQASIFAVQRVLTSIIARRRAA